MYEYFYHSITKKAVVAFGSLFNDIHIARFNSDGSEKERIKVPLSYMTKQKFISRLEQDPSLNNPYYMALPRMSFEFANLTYDASRKNDSIQKSISKGTDSFYSFRYGRIPYNLTFMLHIFAKNTDDALQIMEQILPWFGPEYSVNIKMLNPTDVSVDVPFIIQGVSYDEDVEESDFETRKTVSASIEFNCKLYYYGNVTEMDFGATGGTSGFGDNVLIPQGMVGKVLASVYDIDSTTPFETLETGLTGAVSATSFSVTASNQTYLIYGNRTFS